MLETLYFQKYYYSPAAISPAKYIVLTAPALGHTREMYGAQALDKIKRRFSRCHTLEIAATISRSTTGSANFWPYNERADVAIHGMTTARLSTPPKVEIGDKKRMMINLRLPSMRAGASSNDDEQKIAKMACHIHVIVREPFHDYFLDHPLYKCHARIVNYHQACDAIASFSPAT